MASVPPPELVARYHHLLGSMGSKEIRKHLPLLRDLAGDVMIGDVVEFGVKHCNSTIAFLMAQPKRLVSVDLVRLGEVDFCEEYCGDTEFIFKNEDCRTVDFGVTDFLFIDSTHTGQHLQTELDRHSGNVRKYIGFHDTVKAGVSGWFYKNKFPELAEQYPGVSIRDKGWKTRGSGIRPVIDAFVERESDWDLLIDDRRDHGVVVLVRHGE